jgi:DNA-binding MarR family transcriptional regulator
MQQLSYKSGLLFSQAYKAVHDHIYNVLSKYELTPSYWAIMGAALDAQEDGVTLAEVARQMDVKAPLVTMLSNDLIERDLICRIPHKTDHRAKLLFLTHEGKKLALKVEKEVDQVIKSLVKGVNAKDTAGFQRTLENIIVNSLVLKTNKIRLS